MADQPQVQLKIGQTGAQQTARDVKSVSDALREADRATKLYQQALANQKSASPISPILPAGADDGGREFRIKRAVRDINDVGQAIGQFDADIGKAVRGVSIFGMALDGLQGLFGAIKEAFKGLAATAVAGFAAIGAGVAALVIIFQQWAEAVQQVKKAHEDAARAIEQQQAAATQQAEQGTQTEADLAAKLRGAGADPRQAATVEAMAQKAAETAAVSMEQARETAVQALGRGVELDADTLSDLLAVQAITPKAAAGEMPRGMDEFDRLLQQAHDPDVLRRAREAADQARQTALGTTTQAEAQESRRQQRERDPEIMRLRRLEALQQADLAKVEEEDISSIGNILWRGFFSQGESSEEFSAAKNLSETRRRLSERGANQNQAQPIISVTNYNNSIVNSARPGTAESSRYAESHP